MNIINLSKKQFEKLEPISLPREVLNTEGEIIKYTHHREERIIKKLYHQNGYIFANKLYTLEALDSNKELLPNALVVPDYLIAVHNKIVGFTTPLIEGTNLATILASKDYTYREQLYYLKKIGELLQELKAIRTYTKLKDIYLNDLHEANFIIDKDKKNISVVDLDSCKIGSNSPFASKYLSQLALLNNIEGKYKYNLDPHSQGYIIADENTDLYCYTIMILNFLRGDNVNNYTLDQFYNYLNFMESIDISKDLLQVFYKLLTNTNNENPYLLLDEIEPHQIYKIRTKRIN